MFKRKAVVSLNTFALLLFLFLALFAFFFFNYISKSNQAEILILKEETLIQNLNFKSQIIQILSKENSSTIIPQNLNKLDYLITLENSTVIFQRDSENYFITINESLYGIKFCEKYEISYLYQNEFLFNGSCILLT